MDKLKLSQTVLDKDTRSKLELLIANQTEQKKTDVVIADKETSGKTFWSRFKEEQKDFEKKIYLNENIDDFKYYFSEKKKQYIGDTNRKVLNTLEDYEGLRHKLQKKKEQKEKHQSNVNTEMDSNTVKNKIKDALSTLTFKRKSSVTANMSYRKGGGASSQYPRKQSALSDPQSF